ncbi:MAG: NIL domain-containing protein [Desulfovibrionales bacterium]
MNERVKEHKRIISLAFPPLISGDPVMCNLAKRYNLVFNILKARINPRQEGHMIVELSGKEEDYHEGISYLKDQGITITPVAQQISRDEEACIHCGICTALCVTKALHLDEATRIVVFDSEKCTGCGLCTQVCPVHAMNTLVDEF